MRDHFPRPLGWTVIAMLCLALLPLPYGYYTLLRLVTCVGFAWSAVVSYQQAMIGWAVAAGVLALLYNPMIPVHLGRDLWIVVNLLSAGAMAGLLWALAQREQRQEENR